MRADSLNARVEANLDLAYHAAMTTRHLWADPEIDSQEAKAAAVAGMVYGDRRFDPTKHAKGEEGWAQYVWMWARAKAQEAMVVTRSAVSLSYRAKGTPSTVPLTTVANDGVGGDPLDSSMILFEAGVYTEPHDREIVRRLGNEKTVAKALDALTSNQRYVFVRVFGLEGHVERTQDDVASELGISRQAVGHRYHGGLKKMREALA